MKNIIPLIVAASLFFGCKKKEVSSNSFVDFTIINPIKTSPDTVKLVATSRKNETIFKWDFGDGNTQNGGMVVTHSYANTGIYIVALTVSNSKDPHNNCGCSNAN